MLYTLSYLVQRPSLINRFKNACKLRKEFNKIEVYSYTSAKSGPVWLES